MKVVAPGTTATVRPDAELAAHFSQGVEPLHDVLLRGARRLTHNDADAEDLLQDTLLHAFAGFHNFRPGTNLRAWLFRIQYNRWVSTYRSKQSRVTETAFDEIHDWDLAASASHESLGLRSAEDEVLDRLPDNDIWIALRSLPEGFRAAVYYADIEGHTYAETAVLMGVPIGTVMSRIYRGRERLRVALAHRGPRVDAATDQQTAA
ncbi:sigma-70 family RNA polymerase sigma factor [Mycobacterium sp. NPDC050551]|uniref:sigma-70 family RNA polymerase sigma factor n=1 Tax=Mycobacterium sp. NPDC050551 TaxID=3155407 RepID=UPI00343BF4B3